MPLAHQRHVAGQNLVVGVAQPRRGHLNQDLAGARRVQLEFLDGPRPADVVQDGAATPHVRRPR